jgi:hypothetical protein
MVALSYSDQPESGLFQIERSQNSDTLLHHGQQRAADCGIRERSHVERSSFDQQIWVQPGRTKARKLRPKAPLPKRRVEVVHRLALHDAGANPVVASTEYRQLDRGTPPLERFDDPAVALENVDGDRRTRARTHRVRACPSTCAPFFSKREKE